MNNLVDVYDAIENIASDSSLINKELLIKKYSQSLPNFNRIVQYSYDYLKIYNIKKFLDISHKELYEKNLKKGNINEDSVDKIFEFLDFLSSQSGVKDKSIYKLMELSSLDEDGKTLSLVGRICQKDLKCGAASKIFSKQIPLNLYKGVILCSDDYIRFFNKECKGDFSNSVWSCKLDGVRLTASLQNKNISLLSRNGKPLNNFIEPLEKELNIFFNELYLRTKQYYSADGEALFVENNNMFGTFQHLMKNIQALTPENINKIQYHIFDLIIENVKFIDRYNLLKSIFDSNKDKFQKLKLVKHFECKDYFTNIDELEVFLSKKTREDKWEGLVLKTKNGLYEFKRSKQFCKLKEFITEDLEVVGYELGEKGKQFENVLGKLICKLSNGKTVGVGSGYSFEERKAFLKNQPKVIEVQFQELTNESIPRFPSFLRIVED